MRFSERIAIFFIFISLLLSVTGLSHLSAQFSVVSVSPAHGSTNVDTSATISITFSAAVDTSARFPFPEDFFLSLYFWPDSLVGQPDSLSISPDGKTVTLFGLSLVDNTEYLFIIVDAVSQSGDSLDSPASIYITTGPTLPTGNVQGTISFPGGDPSGSIALLLDGNPFGEAESNILYAGAAQPGTFDYLIDYVSAGTYFPVALKDFIVDEFGEIDLKPGSAIGMYDPNGDGAPDSITVPGGGTVSAVDMTLFQSFLQTARGPFPAIETQAQGWAADARFVQLGGDLGADGRGLFWQYAFYSPSLAEYRAYFTIGNLIIVGEVDGEITDTTALPLNWLDSDTVMSVAEANGGSDFRLQYSDAQSSAFLGYLRFQNESTRGISWKWKGHRNLRFTLSAAKGAVVNSMGFATLPAPPVWGVEYYSDSAWVGLSLIIDAETGELLNEPTTAAGAEQLARPLAQSWASDSKLYLIGPAGTDVDPQGKTDFWICYYYSPSIDSLYGVLLWGHLLVDAGVQDVFGPDTTTVAQGWLDSDVTIAVAEAAGGADYRNNNQNVFVQATLSRWFSGADPSLSVWQFDYSSSNAPPLQFIVDALTGNLVVTGIEDENDEGLPNQFKLYQNYPNPFNPLTTIRFYLPEASHVALEIYNVSGEKVATLVDGRLSAGEHHINFDASRLASGVYFYRVVTSGWNSEKKMILLK